MRYRNLFTWRRQYGFGKIDAVLLCCYSIILCIAIAFHEPWSDEAQAWLIARDNTFWQIFRYRSHYEGAPAGWHFLLRLLQLAHVPWPAVNYVIALFAVLGMYVLLRWSPFPLIVRLLLPFNFFLQYQYAAISRSYVLFPLLTFALCVAYTARRRHVIGFAVIAGLLASLCMQGILLSGMLTVFYLWDLRRERKDAPDSITLPTRRSLAAAMAVLLIFFGTALYCSIPAPDVNFAVTDQVADGVVHKVLTRFIDETKRTGPATLKWRQVRHQFSAVSTSGGIASQSASFDRYHETSDFIFGDNSPAVSVSPKPDSQLPSSHAPSFSDSPSRWFAFESYAHSHGLFGDIPNVILENTFGFLSQVTWALSESNLLACAFVITLIFWMGDRRQLHLLLPWFVLLLVGQIVWVVDHHEGMLFIALLAALWIAARHPTTHQASRRTAVLLLSFTVLILVEQVLWCGFSVAAEINGCFDPGRETARFIKTLPAAQPDGSPTRIAAFHFYSVATQPYFVHSPYYNVPTAYWPWSSNVDTDANFVRTIRQLPEYVVYTRQTMGEQVLSNQWVPLKTYNLDRDDHTSPPDVILDDLAQYGYRETHRFCGKQFFRFSSSYRVCDIIYQPGPQTRSRAKLSAQSRSKTHFDPQQWNP